MFTSEFGRTLTRLRLDPHEVARSTAAAGERVVGYVGNDIPVALILAAGALPVRLRAAADAATSRSEHFIETSFAPELRIIANQWLEGALDHLDAVIFSRSDDSGQRLYYYMCELQRRGLCVGPRPLLYDVATLERKASFEHTLESTRLLAAELACAGKQARAGTATRGAARGIAARPAGTPLAARAAGRQCRLGFRIRRRLRLA